MLVDLVGRHPAAARDGVGRGRHVKTRPEIDDRDVLARVESALERFRRDAGDAKRPEIEPPAHELHQDVPEHDGHDDETERAFQSLKA